LRIELVRVEMRNEQGKGRKSLEEVVSKKRSQLKEGANQFIIKLKK